MTTAFVFPGQGSQAIGMGQSLKAAYPEAAAVFAEVDEALGQDLSKTMFEGPIETLTLTENAQPALMAVSIAALRVLEAKTGKSLADMASHVAGHSLGEYAALCAAGVINLTDTARLLKLRGQAMQRAVPVGEGAMAAIIGPEISVVQEIANLASEGEVCSVANDNAPGQVVISGAKAAIDRALIIAKEKGAKRALPLPVSAPFHCALMQPAADEMAAALAATTFNAPSVPVITNVTASAVSDSDQLKTLLVEQVTGVVRWNESVAAMSGMGISNAVEIGAGKVLTGLVRRIDKSLTTANINDEASLEAYLES
ncbi:MAG: ACP S-malonyltransferase [Alphaproteobacteria bacterium]